MSVCAAFAEEAFAPVRMPRTGVCKRELARLTRPFLEVLSPTRCAGCERPGALICPACLNRLGLIDPATSCMRCGAPGGYIICTECGNPTGASVSGASAADDESPLSRVLATAVFEDPLPRIVRAYKDGGERGLAPLIAQMLLDTAEHAQAEAPDRYGGVLAGADALVFVPATARAYRRRGFDHMEGIVRELGELAGVPVVDALVKHGSADQRRLGRAGRQASSWGAYETVEQVEGMRLLLVDDVITTGATLRSAARALADAGAAHIDALAVARVC